jgi:hypothetical protein
MPSSTSPPAIDDVGQEVEHSTFAACQFRTTCQPKTTTPIALGTYRDDIVPTLPPSDISTERLRRSMTSAVARATTPLIGGPLRRHR